MSHPTERPQSKYPHVNFLSLFLRGEDFASDDCYQNGIPEVISCRIKILWRFWCCNRFCRPGNDHMGEGKARRERSGQFTSFQEATFHHNRNLRQHNRQNTYKSIPCYSLSQSGHLLFAIIHWHHATQMLP